MNPGDLVTPREGAGFSWWYGHPFLVIARDGEWLELTCPLFDGKIIESRMHVFRHISQGPSEEG